MRPAPTRLGADRRAIAAIEFAIVVPVLLLIMGGLGDFSLAFWSKGLLANSVSQGAEYAALVGTGVTTTNVKTVVQQTLSLPTASVTVTGPSCYCVTGTPAVATSQTCGVNCPNATAPGTYLRISATYTYTSMMPLVSNLIDPVMTETAMVRLQ